MIALNVHIRAFDFGLIEKDIDVISEQLADQIQIEAQKILEVPPARHGRLYRRGAIKGRLTKKGLLSGLKQSGNRLIIGQNIHRASAPGEAPAKDTGRLQSNITVRKSGRGRYQVRFGAPYAGILEFELNRPFILPAIDAAVKAVFEKR
jgi:hypothetical protein